jgi:cytochrome c oxidase subunit 2
VIVIAATRRRVLIGLCQTAALVVLGGRFRRDALAESQNTVEILVRRFEFVPHEMTLTVNQSVTLNLRSVDFIHGFNLPDLGIRADLLPGMVTPVPITPSQIGTLEFHCDNFCGEGHERMNGRFIVTA